MQDVIVMGAGMAGLACARALRRAGFTVTVLEKARGVGGRLATRRVQDTQVDHGAQYLSVRGNSFERFVQELRLQGVAREWTRTIYSLTDQGLQEPPLDDLRQRYVCSEGMTAVAKYLANGIDVQLKQRIVNIEANAEGWQLSSESGEQWSSTNLVSTLPAPQFLALFESLLKADPAFLKTVRSVTFDPSLAVMAGYRRMDHEPLPSAWQAIRCPEDAVLSWIALDSSRRTPDDAERQPVFVLQSTADFARHYLDGDLDQAGTQMLAQAASYLEPWLREPEWWQIHRWRYALPSETLGVSCLSTVLRPEKNPLRLVCAGDWCIGPSVESAYLSGLAAAERLGQLLTKVRIGQA
ncbi:NAD(P)/FAD-dependent oxidoreductase [Leptolyngbya sp. FACHB-261]|uniref:NAD(P)/FAD-dependent oxidoreductase n=1 Tax=Leptolyngbya sp. FACHB-261 TaxID=2692806 RepID=UPI001684AE9B|nr:FAD-dependent oxidoreductase [Leptolyngbya sp. FACHB-261]MBD2101582.1 FAD-dependent oxidoreductase [Leptolyngbya sp. FACHB-261]